VHKEQVNTGVKGGGSPQNIKNSHIEPREKCRPDGEEVEKRRKGILSRLA